MAQHDYQIADQPGAGFLADLNAALAAIVSQNSGATEPSPSYAYQWWADTTSGKLKLRNGANTAWIEICSLADPNLGLIKGAITASGLTQSTGKLLGRTSSGAGQIEELNVVGPLALTGGALTTSMNTDKLLGRTSAGSGAIEEISAGTGLTLASGVLNAIIASTAEAQAGTDNTKLMTPARLADAFKGANQSLASSGYQKLPSGLIIQWGTAAPGYGSVVNLPIAFSSTAYQAVAVSSTTASNSHAVVQSLSSTQITLANNNNGGTIRWLAWGI